MDRRVAGPTGKPNSARESAAERGERCAASRAFNGSSPTANLVGIIKGQRKSWVTDSCRVKRLVARVTLLLSQRKLVEINKGWVGGRDSNLERCQDASHSGSAVPERLISSEAGIRAGMGYPQLHDVSNRTERSSLFAMNSTMISSEAAPAMRPNTPSILSA